MRPEDASLKIRFFMDRVENPFKSREAGRPVFDDVETIVIRVPGARDDVNVLVNDEYRERFRDEYEAWKRKLAEPVSGMPLTEWPPASRSFVDEMAALGIRSVEELAHAKDDDLTGSATAPGMRSRALAYLEFAGEQAKLDALAKRNAELEAQVTQLTKELEEATKPAAPAPVKGAKAA